MKNIKFFYICIILIFVLLSSCNKSGKFVIDTTKNRVEVKIHRFDKDLINLDTLKLKIAVDSLFAHYPGFLPAYTSEVLDTSFSDTTAISNLFVKFLRDTTFSSVNKKTLETFGNVSDIEKNLSDAFTYIHHYFPEIKLPEIYFFVSGFNRSIIMNKNFIGIGTDLYLGNNFPAYKNITYEYLLYNMRRESLPIDIVSAIIFSNITMKSAQNRLVYNMLYRGKIMYILSMMMPNEKQEDLMGYTTDQWKWCNTYQKEIWAATINQKDLFSTDLILIGKYMNDAPFTSPISQDSPGRLGTWIGWQIVKSYMTKNDKISLNDLSNDNDYQKMLENSGYRP